MRLCDHLGTDFVVVPRIEVPPEEQRKALKPSDAVAVLMDLFIGPDSEGGSVRDALLEMAGNLRFDLFWRRSLEELKGLIANELSENGRLIMIRAPSPSHLSVVRTPPPDVADAALESVAPRLRAPTLRLRLLPSPSSYEDFGEAEPTVVKNNPG